jgi:pimeloyl-ACP methyl ester carboxylesterase
MSSQVVRLVLSIAVVACLSGCTSRRTTPIVDEQGHGIAGSVATLEQIRLGGVSQWILIRGNSVENPLLLKLHGGPGQAEMATVRFNRLLEKDFIVVEWDQRGAGKSAQAIDPERAMNIAQLVEDTHELTQFLLKRFHRKNLILVGSSWGSVIGIETVKKYPDEYRAFVSTGQIANFTQGMDVGYRFLVAEAQKRNDTKALNQLAKIGPSPYRGDDGDAKKSFDLLLPQLAVDLDSAVPKVEVPIYFAVGRYDRMAPFEVSQAYFSILDAPKKEWVWFENSAHFPQWEEMEKFHDLLADKVLPETRSREY